MPRTAVRTDRDSIGSLAAEKLANATRTHKSSTLTSCLNEQFQHNIHQSLTSSILAPANFLLKHSTSNGSGIENFSSDDADERLCMKQDCAKTVSSSNSSNNQTQLLQCQRSERNNSQHSLLINADESKLLPMSECNFACRNRITGVLTYSSTLARIVASVIERIGRSISR